eukprot:COSAG02_NODE_1506_length_12232_cov_420.616088_17_plen_143_part_00
MSLFRSDHRWASHPSSSHDKFSTPQVWGRDEGGGGLIFKQIDIDKIVQVKDHCGELANYFPMKEDYAQTLLHLCVSDVNKQLLLNCDGFIPLMVDSLLLNPQHPRRAHPDFDSVAPPVQRVSAAFLSHFAALQYPEAQLLPA